MISEVGRELVEGVRDRDHQGDRRDDQHESGNHQAGDAEKGDDGLTLAGHQVDATQRLRNPDHPRQADQDQRKRRERRAKNVLVDRPHRHRTIPPCRLELRLTTNPEIGIPLVAPPLLPAVLLSHYHPFDPSTKWLRHGALKIWLIIRQMWPSSHCRAWQRSQQQAIVGPTMLLTDVNRSRREHSKHRPADSRPAAAPILED